MYNKFKNREKMITCIKNIETKKGLKFIKGNQYKFTIQNNSIRIYFNEFKSLIIKNEKTLNKYFK